MGLFTWLTADTQEVIPAQGFKGGARAIHLLQPDGKPAIAEDLYEGYGHFGKIDAIAWLGRNNLPKDVASALSEQELEQVGHALGSNVYRDINTNEVFRFKMNESNTLDSIDEIKATDTGMYSEPHPKYGVSPTELIEQGVWVEHKYNIAFPLKFSFDANAVYEDLPASEQAIFKDGINSLFAHD